jgi:hypothetical protein
MARPPTATLPAHLHRLVDNEDSCDGGMRQVHVRLVLSTSTGSWGQNPLRAVSCGHTGRTNGAMYPPTVDLRGFEVPERAGRRVMRTPSSTDLVLRQRLTAPAGTRKPTLGHHS